jgi:hypothetical protein
MDSEFGMLITQFAIDATTSMTASFVKRPIDFADSYGFTGLQGNLIWATDPLQVLDDPNPTTGWSDDFKITVTAEDDATLPNNTGWITHPDTIYPNAPINAQFLTGLTRAELNAAISNFQFWPYHDQTSDTMIHVEIEQLFTSQTFPDGAYFDVLNTHIDLTYLGAATLPATRYFTYNGDSSVPVTLTEMIYQPFTFDIIGGGGSGGYQYRGTGAYSDAGGGGGAGQYTRPSTYYMNVNKLAVGYNTMGVGVGTGGAAPTSDGANGNDGTHSEILLGQNNSTAAIPLGAAYKSNGGFGGYSSDGASTVTNGDGGDSGATLSTSPIFSGGLGGEGTHLSSVNGGGGGGGWLEDLVPANQNGEDGVVGTGQGHAAGGAGATVTLIGDSVTTTVAVGGFGGETGNGDSGTTSSTVNTGPGCGGNGAGGNSGQVPTAGINGEIRIKIGA